MENAVPIETICDFIFEKYTKLKKRRRFCQFSYFKKFMEDEMKKVISILLLACLLFCFVGCGDQSNTPDNSSVLESPKNLRYAGGYLRWNIVDHSDGYVISIDGDEYSTSSNMFNVSALSLPKGSHTAKVRAVGDGEYSSSQYSPAIVFNISSDGNDTDVELPDSGEEITESMDILADIGYIGHPVDSLELSNAINIDNKYYVYYFYLGTVERSPVYSSISLKYTKDMAIEFSFDRLVADTLAKSISNTTEIIETESISAGVKNGFESETELGAEFLGSGANIKFKTSTSSERNWAKDWGTTVSNSESTESSYLEEYSEGFKVALAFSEENGFVKGNTYRVSFYETVKSYGVLIYDATSTASDEREKYTVAYQSFFEESSKTMVIEESTDGNFDYCDEKALSFDVNAAINIAAANKPVDLEASTLTEYHLKSPVDFEVMRNNTKGKTFILDNDISFKSVNWTPIEKFDGTLIGNGHNITNLSFNFYNGAAGDWGLFKTISEDGSVENVTFKSCSAKYIAPSVGNAISNVKFGFLATYNYGSISDCVFTSNSVDIDADTKVSDQFAYVGIAVCENYGTIHACTSTNNYIHLDSDSVDNSSADDKSTVAVAGGLCAYNQRSGQVSSCTATGNTVSTRACYLSDEGEDVKAVSGGMIAFQYGIQSNNSASSNTLTATKRYYEIKWNIFGNFTISHGGDDSGDSGQLYARN